MIENRNLLKFDELPAGFSYPTEFLILIEQNLVNLNPWFIFGFGVYDSEHLRDRYLGLMMRYPGRKLIPFARRADNDDVACWDMRFPEKVIVIHDHASPGWEEKQNFESFWDWFRAAVDGMISYNEL